MAEVDIEIIQFPIEVEVSVLNVQPEISIEINSTLSSVEVDVIEAPVFVDIEIVQGIEARQGVPIGGTTGQVLTKVSNSDYETTWEDPQGGSGYIPPKSPVFTYTDGALTGIEYEDGSTKTLTYAGGILTTLVFIRDGVTSTKTFNYTSGILQSINEVIT